MMRVLIAFLLLCGCSGTVVQDRPQTVSVPVTVACVSGDRPEPVTPMKEQYPDWYDKSLKQKTEITSAQAAKHKSYGQQLNASTSACK